MKKRLFALFLALVMVIGLMPASAIAADGYSGTIVVRTTDMTSGTYGGVPYMDLELAIYTDTSEQTRVFAYTFRTGKDGTATLKTSEIDGLDAALAKGYLIEINPISGTSAYGYHDIDASETIFKVRHIASDTADSYYNAVYPPTGISIHQPYNHVAILSGGSFSYTLDLFLGKESSLGDLTVKYAAGEGATGTAPDSASVAYGGSVTLPSGLTKTGYRFDGWSDGTKTYAAGDTIYNYYNLVEYTEMDGTLTLTAQWTANSYDASFNANGGAWDNDDTSKTVTTVFGTAITAPADPTRTGYTFDGWSPEVGDMTAEGMTFTAQWKANSYNVTLDPNGGSVDSTEVTVTYDAAYGELPTPTNGEYDFDGWYDGNTKIESTTKVTKTEDHTLTAKWSHKCTDEKDHNGFCDICNTCLHTKGENNYCTTTGCEHESDCACHPDPTRGVRKITIYTRDENGNAIGGVSVSLYLNPLDGTPKEDHPILATVTTDANGTAVISGDALADVKAGQRLYASVSGTSHSWDTSKNARTATAGDNTAVFTHKEDNNNQYIDVSTSATAGIGFNASFTLTGVTLREISVTFDAGDVALDDAEKTKTVTIGQPYGELPAPSKEGYTFDGWYDGSNKIESTTTVTKTEDHTLTAKWTANPYTISFDSKGGSAVDSITLAYGAAITAPADPTRTGYTFDGWSPSIPDTMPVNGLTVTAQWKANSYTVSFDSNGGSAVDSKTVTYDAAYGTLPVPTREGCTFEGWIHNGGKVEADTVVKTAGNHSLTASWSHVCKDDNEDGRCDICDICLHGKPEGDAYCSVSGCQHYLECMCHPDPTRGERTVDIKTVLANGSPAANVSVQLYVNPNNGNAHYPIGSVYTTDANGLVTITDDVLDDLPYGVTIYCGIAGSGWDWESAHPVRTVYGPYLVNAGPVKDSNGNGYVWLVAPAGVGFTANFTCIVKQTGTVTPPEDTTPEEPNQPEDPTPTTYTVTYTDGVANAELFADQSHTVESGAATPAFNGTPSREGYTFEGWSPAVANTVTGNVTYTAQWKEIETPTPEDPVPATYTVKFYANGGVWADGSVVNTQTVAENGKLTVPADPVRAGYEFIGWTPAVSETVTADVNYFAVWVEIPEEDEDDDYDDIELPDYAPVYVAVRGLNTADHVAYIVGYGDGTVNPTGTITRAEVATIFFRLMTDDARDKYWSNSNPFSDVSEANWFNTAVSTLYAAGAIVDCDDEFRPNDPITRAELAVMAAQFARVYNGSVPAASFTDVSKNHWAAEEIAIVQFAGWIEGYKGEYRPEDTLTRAECMTIVNRMLQRGAESENMLPGMVTFSDNLPSAWYYEAVLEAANSHTYTRSGRLEGESFRGEIWVKLLDAPDWAAMEKAWAEANKD